MNSEDKITPLANIPLEHMRYEFKTYLSLPKWTLIFSRNDYYDFIKNNPSHHFPHSQIIKNYWKSYWIMDKFTKKKARLNIQSHIRIMGLGIGITAEFLLKGIYEKTIGLLTYQTCREKTEQEELIEIIGQNYSEFIKYQPWYDFDFFSRIVALLKSLKNLPQNPRQFLRKMERTFFSTFELTFKAFLALVAKGLFFINYHRPNTRTAIELDYIPQDFLDDSNVDLIGEYQKHLVISVPRYFDFQTYVKKMTTDNMIHSIAGNRDETLICCILPEAMPVHAIKLEPVLVQKSLCDNSLRVIYKIKMTDLINFCRFCVLKQLKILHIFDF